MKPKLLILCLIGIAGVALFWFVLPSANQQTIHPTADEPVVSKLKQRPGDTQAPVQPILHSGTVPQAVTSNVATESAETAWLNKHSAGIAVNQTQQGKLQYPGSIKVGGVTVDLGETPPLIHHQLKAKAGSLLLGELDDRHSYQRHLGMVRVTEGRPQVSYEVALSYPRSSTIGGLVLKRNEAEVSEIGIIIPEIRVPAGDDATAPQWAMSIRIGNRELSAEELANAKPQPLGTDTVLVMPTHPGLSPKKARVLWLALDANGSFVVAHK